MIKILYILTDTNVGGAGLLTVSLIRRLDSTAFDVSVAVPRGSALVPLLRDARADAEIIETLTGRDRSFELAAIRELKRIIKRVKPDIVHTNASLSGRIAAVSAGVPSVIYTRHCAFANKEYMMSYPAKIINGFISRRYSTRVIATADVAREKLIEIGVPDDMITVIVNGAEQFPTLDSRECAVERDRLGIAGDDFVVYTAARLEEYKGYRYIIGAARILKEKCPCVRFVCIGDGSMRAELESLSVDLDNIMFLGFCGEPYRICNIADVCLSCSYGAETTSLAISEGMSLGKPQIVTRSGGYSQLIDDGVDGICIEPQSAEAVAESVIQLYNNEKLRRQLGNAAKEKYLSALSADRMACDVTEIYLEEYKKHSGVSI
ncbi:MAG: glycosyltransferase family 4 protein [Clostridia bacterium]|nr:glycosyltransferase family 4 protein [Clostridia bacterium]